MERTFTRATRSHLQPVEIGKRLVRTMESEQSVGMDGIIVPNAYDLYLSPYDYEHFKNARSSVSRNLESHIGRTARQRRFHMVARPVVRIHSDDQLDAGDIRVMPRMQDVDAAKDNLQHTSVLPTVSGPLRTSSATPNLVWNGRSFAVLRSPTNVGRQPDNDIVLNDKRVSRHHATVIERQGRWVLQDRNSTNGTSVNGKVVKEAVLKPGDTISLGGLEVQWEQ